MPAYNKHQFQAHLDSPEKQNVGSAADASDLRSAIDSPTGQLPLFAMAKDLKPAVKVLEGDRTITDRLPTDSPELAETHGYDEQYRYETDDEVWDRKLNEASIPGQYEKPGAPPSEWSSLREDITRNGMYRPVRVAASHDKPNEPPGVVLNGHHRIAAMAADHPDSWVNVDWDDDWQGAGGTDGATWRGKNTQDYVERSKAYERAEDRFM
jgi:hypothetical protein